MQMRSGCFKCRLIAVALGVCFVVGCAMLKKFEQPLRDLLHCPKQEQPQDPLPVFPDVPATDAPQTPSEPDPSKDDPNWESRKGE